MSEYDETRPVQAAGLLDHDPEVRAFVAAVRRHLGDLTEEEREELVGGLDADMSDLVAERGRDALPDPTAYAAELRGAAGFSPEAPAARGAVRDRAMAWLDRGSATWNRWVATGDHLGLPAFAASLRPAWWVVRALCAAALVAELFTSQGVFGFTPERALVAVVAVWGSVQLGRGRWWPGTLVRRSLAVRAGLIGLNVLAIALLPVMFTRFMAPMDPSLYLGEPSYSQPPGDGLSLDGEPVANIYPYDAQGRPLTGVQLVDRQGRRLPVTQDPYDEGDGWGEFVHAPWRSGSTELYSVFPLPEQTLDPESLEPVGDPRLQAPPFASLPPVTSPLDSPPSPVR